MDHFQDLQILSDPEFSTPILLNALFAKLHRCFVRIDNRLVGISFPRVEYDRPSLGNILRLHGNAESLLRIQKEEWPLGMRDHMEIKAIAPVPDGCQYCRVRRVQVKSSAERLRRRYAKRHQDASVQQIKALLPVTMEKRLQLPYLRLMSESTGHYFMLFLNHEAPQENFEQGDFNCYGLSEKATVPWF